MTVAARRLWKNRRALRIVRHRRVREGAVKEKMRRRRPEGGGDARERGVRATEREASSRDDESDEILLGRVAGATLAVATFQGFARVCLSSRLRVRRGFRSGCRRSAWRLAGRWICSSPRRANWRPSGQDMNKPSRWNCRLFLFPVPIGVSTTQCMNVHRELVLSSTPTKKYSDAAADPGGSSMSRTSTACRCASALAHDLALDLPPLVHRDRLVVRSRRVWPCLFTRA